MNAALDDSQFNLLRAINTPTLANAMESLGIRGRCEGYTTPAIRCMFPELGPMLGYAVTARMRSATSGLNNISMQEYWDHFTKYPAPRVVVVQDMDQPPAGALWGEVNSNIHRALGCVGVVTDGLVRDLDEVGPLGFQFLAAGVAVSHAWAHLEDFGKPVTVSGMAVQPGDLVHADKHGAIVIPVEAVAALLAAVASVERYERPIIQLCKSVDFSTKSLDKLIRNKIV